MSKLLFTKKIQNYLINAGGGTHLTQMTPQAHTVPKFNNKEQSEYSQLNQILNILKDELITFYKKFKKSKNSKNLCINDFLKFWIFTLKSEISEKNKKFQKNINTYKIIIHKIRFIFSTFYIADEIGQILAPASCDLERY